MFIARNTLGVGDRVRSTKAINVMGGTFTAGHEFTIVGESERGWDLRDDDGREVIEVGYTNFEKVNS